MGGLFLLSRRSQGGMGGPGGNNPLAFGKSKAKFQMEPNTGITFDDVAGVDEAKQDFMEVRAQGFPKGQGFGFLKGKGDLGVPKARAKAPEQTQVFRKNQQ